VPFADSRSVLFHPLMTKSGTKSTEQQVPSYAVMNFYPKVCQSQGFDSDDREYRLIIPVTPIFRNPQHLSLLLNGDSATLSGVLH
jgi:hypothetical protein